MLGYNLREWERVRMEFMKVEECPVIGQYIIQPIVRLEVRDSQGNLIRDLLNLKKVNS